MNIQIDLYKLCGTLGFEAIQKMFDANMVNRDQLNNVSYMWKQANKGSYDITVRSVNDGNNTYDEIVYFDIKSPLLASHSHTMSENITLAECINNIDTKRLKLILDGLETIKNLREMFGMPTSMLNMSIAVAKRYLANQ